MADGNLRTGSAALAFAERVLAAVRREYEKDHQLPPTAYVMGDRDPKTGLVSDPPVLAIVRLLWGDTEQQKAQCIQKLKEMADDMHAFGVLWISEVWVKETTPEEYQRQNGSLEFEPGRKEAIHAVLDHAEAGYHWMAFIERDPDGNPTLGPFKREDSRPGVTSDGRLASFIRPRAQDVA